MQLAIVEKAIAYVLLSQHIAHSRLVATHQQMHIKQANSTAAARQIKDVCASQDTQNLQCCRFYNCTDNQQTHLSVFKNYNQVEATGQPVGADQHSHGETDELEVGVADGDVGLPAPEQLSDPDHAHQPQQPQQAQQAQQLQAVQRSADRQPKWTAHVHAQGTDRAPCLHNKMSCDASRALSAIYVPVHAKDPQLYLYMQNTRSCS